MGWPTTKVSSLPASGFSFNRTGALKFCPTFLLIQMSQPNIFFFSTGHRVKYMIVRFELKMGAPSLPSVFTSRDSLTGSLHLPRRSRVLVKRSLNASPTMASVAAPVAAGRLLVNTTVSFFLSENAGVRSYCGVFNNTSGSTL